MERCTWWDGDIQVEYGHIRCLFQQVTNNPAASAKSRGSKGSGAGNEQPGAGASWGFSSILLQSCSVPDLPTLSCLNPESIWIRLARCKDSLSHAIPWGSGFYYAAKDPGIGWTGNEPWRSKLSQSCLFLWKWALCPEDTDATPLCLSCSSPSSLVWPQSCPSPAVWGHS